MEHFRFSSDDITDVTYGHVTLKTINNWVTAREWFSPLAPASRGRSRLFSRLNAIEAGLAHDMMVAGITRRDAKNYINLMATNGRAGGYVADLPDALEGRVAFQPNSVGWYWLLTFSESDGDRILDGIVEVTAAGIAEKLMDNPHAAVVIPVSAIVARVDALDANRA